MADGQRRAGALEVEDGLVVCAQGREDVKVVPLEDRLRRGGMHGVEDGIVESRLVARLVMVVVDDGLCAGDGLRDGGATGVGVCGWGRMRMGRGKDAAAGCAGALMNVVGATGGSIIVLPLNTDGRCLPTTELVSRRMDFQVW